MTAEIIPLFDVPKRCRTCNEVKPLSEFHTVYGKPFRACKPCQRIRDRERYASEAKHRRKSAIEYHWNNRARRLAEMRSYNRRNPELRKMRSHEYYQANKSLFIEAANRRKQKLRGATVVKFTPAQLEQRLSMYGDLCWICRKPIASGQLHVDHVKPISRGGPHMLANLRPACAPCNLAKKDRWPFQPPDIAGVLADHGWQAAA